MAKTKKVRIETSSLECHDGRRGEATAADRPSSKAILATAGRYVGPRSARLIERTDGVDLAQGRAKGVRARSRDRQGNRSRDRRRRVRHAGRTVRMRKVDDAEPHRR